MKRSWLVVALLCAAVGSAILWWPKGKAPVVSSRDPSTEQAPQSSPGPNLPSPEIPPPFAVPDSLKPIFAHPRDLPKREILDRLKTLAASPARLEDVEALRWLIRQGSYNNVLRNEAAKVLLAGNPPGLAAELVEMMKDGRQSDVWRTYCVQYLETHFRNHGENAAMEGILSGISSENVPVRCQSIFSMASVASDLQWEKAEPEKYRDLVGKSKEFVAEGDSRLVVSGLRAAARAEIKELAGEAERLASDEKRPLEIRAAAVQALGKVGRSESLPILEKCAKAKDSWVAQCARSSRALLASGRKE